MNMVTWMEQLCALDSAFIFAEEPNLPMHIAMVTLYNPSTSPQGKVRLKDIIGLFEQAAYQVPLFRQRLVEVPLDLDQPYWIDDPDFDIEYHVRHIALPRPGDWRQFYIQVARINSRSLDRSRPLWEAYVIEGLNQLDGIPPGSFALLLKLHRAAIDEESVQSLTAALHSSQADVPTQSQGLRRGLARELRRGNLPLLLNASQNSIKRALRLPVVMKDVVQGFRRIRKDRHTGDIQQQHPIPHSRFNGELSPYRTITSFAVDYAQANDLRQSLAGASMTDLVLTIIGGALRLYLQAQGELPEVSLVAGAPLRLHQQSAGETDNGHISMLNMPVHSEIDDPLERLFAVHEASVSAKYYLLARGEDLREVVADIVHPYLTRTMLTLQENLGRLPLLAHIYPASANTLLYEMPGSMTAGYLCGAHALHSFGLGVCMPDIGLAHTSTTANGQLTISVNACRSMLPDPELYQQCLARSWELTCAALGSEARRHQPAAKRKIPRKKRAAEAPAKRQGRAG
jgi:WS/DGAT/MGAT family acyltransferase